MAVNRRREWVSRALTHAAAVPRGEQRAPVLTPVGPSAPTPAEVIGAAKLHASDIGLVTNAQQRIIHISETFTAITGYVLDDVVGRTCGFLQGADTDPATVRDMGQVLRSGKAYEGELLNYRKDGAAFWNALRVMPLRLGSGQDVTHFVSVQCDVSNRVALLEQLRVQALRDAVTGLPPNRRPKRHCAGIVPAPHSSSGSSTSTISAS